MCRLYGFLANEPTKVDCSLVFSQNALMQQSRVDQTGRDHTDGWGIASYQDGVPVVDKRTNAAYEGLLFSAAAEKAYSKTIVAHVRRATVGLISIENTHPFVNGSWTFAHNGTVTGFELFREKLEAETDPHLQSTRCGQTDSEQFFLWLLSRLNKHGIDDQTIRNAETTQITDLVNEFVSELAARCLSASPEEKPRLNFVLTNGDSMIACRWNHTLHMISRDGIYDCEICGIPHIHHNETIHHRAVAVASEPVSHEPWREVPNQSVFMVNREFQLVS